MLKSRIKAQFMMLSICAALILSNPSLASAMSVIESNHLSEANAVIVNGFDYIASQINADGGIRWADESSNVSTTIRVVLALAAAHYPQDYLVSASGNRPIDFLLETGSDWIFQTDSEEPGLNVAKAGQLLAAISAANENPHAINDGSLDLVSLVKANFDASTGIFGQATEENVLDQVWAILGLTASHASVPKEAADWLARAQMDDGCWNDGWGSYLDTTPIALVALTASGYYDANSTEVHLAIAYMQTHQDGNGGWLTEWDTVTNADITGMMLQTIASLGQLPMDEDWQMEDGNPHSALLILQHEDGSIGGDYANTYSTADAILGLSGQPLFKLSALKKVSQAFEYIFTAQGSDGGWGDVASTVDVILALRSAGWDPQTIIKDNSTPLSFISENLASHLESGPDAIGKTILGVVAASEDPTDFAGTDLIAKLMATYDDDVSAFGMGDNTWHQALAILGLNAASTDIPSGVIKTLVNLQKEDGGWENSAGFGTGPDSTSLAVQALLAAGIPRDDPVIQSAIVFMQSFQTEEGGWGDSRTTAYMVMALNALELSPDDWTTDSGKAPLPTLFSYQKANGSFVYTWEYADDNLLSTTAVLLAALGDNFLVQLPASSRINYAGLVIDPGEGDITTDCIQFEDAFLNGLELLDDSGLEYEVDGGMIKNILGISNPEGETFFWSYWSFNGREWIFRNTGAGDTQVVPGSIDGWHFSSWEVNPSPPPNFLPDLSTICEVEILKNYSNQPYLNYADMFLDFEVVEQVSNPHEDEQVIEATEEPSPNAEPAGAEDAEEQTQTEKESVVSEESLSRLPIYVLIIVGIAGIAVILFFILRKAS